MRSSLVLKLACLAAILFAIALVQVVKSIDIERYRGVLASMTEQATGQALDIRGRLSLRLSLSPGIEANDLVLPAAAGAAEPYQLTIGHLDVDIAILPLLAGEVRVKKISALGVHFLLEGQDDGTSNWSIQRVMQGTLPEIGMPVTRLELAQFEMEDVSLHRIDHKGNIDQHAHFDHLAADADPTSGKIALTAKGQWEGRQFDVSGIVGNWHDLSDTAKPFPVAVKAVLPGLVTTAKGTFQHGVTGDQTLALAVTADAADVGAAARLFGLTMPPLGAARASFTLTGPPEAPSIAALDLVFGRRDALTFSVKGSVSDPFALKGVDLSVAVDGESLPAFGRALDLVLPALGPVRLSTHLNDTPDGWHFTDIKGGSRQDDIGGHLFLTHTQAGGLSFEAAFDSTKIDLGDLWGAVGEASAEPLPEGHVFSDRPLPFSLLANMDGGIVWNISHLTVAGLPMDDVQLPLTLRDGRLDAALTVGKVAGGRLDATMLVDSMQTPPLVTVNLTTDKVDAGPILAALGDVTGLQGAPSDLHLALTASGDSVHTIISRLMGEGSLAIGSGSFDGGISIDEAPWLKADRIGLGCGYSHFTIADGLAVTESIVLDLTPVTIGGRGSINLGREELDLVFVPRSKESGESGALVPLDVGGTLRHPSLLPARGTVVKGVAPLLPPLMGAGISACEAAATAKKAAPLHHLSHPPAPPLNPGVPN